MQVNFPNHISADAKDMIESIVSFVCNEYDMNDDEMEVDVDFPVNPCFGGHAAPQTCDEDEDFPMLFEIDLDAELLKNKRELAITLIHEMIHVKQFAMGDLRNYPRSIRYQGKYYRLKDNRIDLEKYYDYPWEKEAYEMEKRLYNKWAKDIIST